MLNRADFTTAYCLQHPPSNRLQTTPALGLIHHVATVSQRGRQQVALQRVQPQCGAHEAEEHPGASQPDAREPRSLRRPAGAQTFARRRCSACL